MPAPHAHVIDDNQRNIQVLKMLLAEQGIDCTVTADPRRVEQDLAALERVDVIFLDLEMPGANGYQVFEFLRSSARFQNVPVVAYTVHLSEMNAVYKHGFTGFIGKPIDPDRFPDQIARILNGESVWEAS